jgi:hypothetical protein
MYLTVLLIKVCLLPPHLNWLTTALNELKDEHDKMHFSFQPAAVQYINYVFDPGNFGTENMFEIGKQEMPQRNVSLCFFEEKPSHQSCPEHNEIS